MSERGNDLATADVRPHAWTAAGLLAIGALMLGFAPASATFALHGGATLVLETAILWYLPSFAKRSLLGPGWLAAAGAILFPAAAAIAFVSIPAATAIAAAGLLHLTLLVLASALFGKRWRSGVPFWRAGSHRAGDLAAAITLALGLALLPAAFLLPIFSVWAAGLGVLTLGILAHFLPRSRGRDPIAPLVVAGSAIVIASVLARGIVPEWVAPLGLLAGAAGIYGGPSPKRAGPRLREAAPPLIAALAALALAIAGLPRALPAAVGIAVLGVAVLALPVVFNQRPARRFAIPASALAAATPVASLLPFPVGTLVGAAAVLCALGALAPLRRPRRYCPPDGPEAS